MSISAQEHNLIAKASDEIITAINALVEQQRIANLIALAKMNGDVNAQEPGVLLDSLLIGAAGEVWEGLGLA